MVTITRHYALEKLKERMPECVVDTSATRTRGGWLFYITKPDMTTIQVKVTESLTGECSCDFARVQ